MLLIVSSLDGPIGVAGLAGAEATVPGLLSVASGFDLYTFGVLGVLSLAGEYRFRTIVTTFAAAPTRLPVVWAKVLVVFVVCTTAAALVAVVGAGVIAASLTLQGRPTGLESAELAGRIGGLAVYGGLIGVIGVGVAAIVRRTGWSIAAMTLWAVALEPVAGLLVPERFGRILPFAAGSALTGPGSALTDLSPVAGGAIFAAFALVLASIGSVVVLRRDTG
jgi:ABC-2 type transport system permease protein